MAKVVGTELKIRVGQDTLGELTCLRSLWHEACELVRALNKKIRDLT